MPIPLRRTLRWWPRLLHRHRRLFVALLVAAAGAAAVQQVSQGHRPATVVVVTADLAAGDELAGRVRATQVPAELVPDGALTTVPGSGRVSAAVRRGEVLTDARLSTTGLAAPPPGRVLVPVPVDAALAPWLRPGQRVELHLAVASPFGDGPALDEPDTGSVAGPAPAEGRAVPAVVMAQAGAESAGSMVAGSSTTTLLLAVAPADVDRTAAAALTGPVLPVLIPD